MASPPSILQYHAQAHQFLLVDLVTDLSEDSALQQTSHSGRKRNYLQSRLCFENMLLCEFEQASPSSPDWLVFSRSKRVNQFCSAHQVQRSSTLVPTCRQNTPFVSFFRHALSDSLSVVVSLSLSLSLSPWVLLFVTLQILIHFVANNLFVLAPIYCLQTG